MSRTDLQIIFGGAALMLRNVAGLPLEPATEEALNSIAAEMKIGRRISFRSSCVSGWRLRMIDEESETDGSPHQHGSQGNGLQKKARA